MGRLTTAHERGFSAIKALCYGDLDSATLRERIGDRLAKHLGAVSYCFGSTDPATALPVHSISVGLDPRAMEAFFGLVLTTPALDFAPWVARRRRVGRLEELVDDIESDPYVTDILRPSGLGHEVQLACVWGGLSWGHMCLRRALGQAPFDGHEIRFLEALAPHLTAGLRNAANRFEQGRRGSGRSGVVVLGADGRVELANGIAESLFRQPTSGTRHSFLSAVNIVANRLERTLSGLDDDVPPELAMTDEATGEVYRLRAERVVGADGRPRGLVTIDPIRPTNESEQRAGLIRSGLSRRECDVAILLARGCSNAEISAQLFMSPHTVGSHARSVYEKLDVRSRQALVFRSVGASF